MPIRCTAVPLCPPQTAAVAVARTRFISLAHTHTADICPSNAHTIFAHQFAITTLIRVVVVCLEKRWGKQKERERERGQQ